MAWVREKFPPWPFNGPDDSGQSPEQEFFEVLEGSGGRGWAASEQVASETRRHALQQRLC